MNYQKNISPLYTLAMLAAVGGLIGLGILIDIDGLRIFGKELSFPNKEDFSPTQRRTVNMQRLLQDYHEIDMLDKEDATQSFSPRFFMDEKTPVDSILNRLGQIEEEQKRLAIPNRSLQWANGAPHPLHRFFESLKHSGNKKIRVLHYGDSQIEGDRITARLRHRLQSEHGGFGPGLQSFTPLVESYSIRSKASSHWKRYPGFGRKDTAVKHNEYGPLITMSRYSMSDSADLPWIEIGPSRVGYKNIQDFQQIKIYFGNVVDNVEIMIYCADTLFASFLIHENTTSPLSFNTPQPLNPIKITFNGISPDWYGYSAESPTGVIIDNIPLRGASGNFFSAIPSSHFTSHFKDEEVRLILLQFGGNVVPYISDDKAVERYGKKMRQEIREFQRRFPNADFIFIGPSDMATKVRTNFETFPYLIAVRDVLRDASFESNIAFWDIFDAMGGKGSISKWVDSEPALAAKDYVHFTIAGSKLVAEWLTQALEKAYLEWELEQKLEE